MGRFRRVRVQVNTVGIITGAGGSAVMAHAFFVDPADITWAAAVWALSMFGMAVCSLVSAWMGNREHRDVNQYRKEVETLKEENADLRLRLVEIEKLADRFRF